MQPVTPSATDVTVHIKIVDSTDFSPETGVTYATSGIDLWYRKGATGAKTSITEATQTVTGAHSDGGIVHVSDGVYRLDLPDAAVPTAEGEVTTFGGTVTGMQVLGGALVGRVVPLAPTVAGRSLDVSSGGEAGIDWANVGTPGSTVALSATTVATVTTTATATTLTNAPSDSSGVTTLLSRLTSTRAGYLDNLSAGPVATAAKLLSYFQSALRKDVTVDTDIGGNYDDATDSQEALRDRGDAAWGASGVAATVWTYETRTLTQGASSVVAAVTGTSVTVYRGVRWSITLTGLTDMTGQTGVWFGVKGNPREDTDTASVCLVKTTTGLIAFAGDATITAGHAAITVNSTTSITITVEADATQYATPGEYSYAVKALNASGKPFMVSSGGTFNVASDIPMAIS